MDDFEKWNITRNGRTWRAGEGVSRYALTPPRFELVNGKLFENDEERTVMLAMLLENLGVDRAVRLGDPNVWRAAVAALPIECTTPRMAKRAKLGEE